MAKLSALVCVHNQEAELSRCLRRLSFCDEVVVVADRCTDRSAEIARRQGAVVVSGIFPLEGQRKAAGLEAASGDWILEISPDELVGSALAWEIRATLQMRPRGDWFDIPVHNYVGDVAVLNGWIGGLATRRAPRLFRPWAKRWTASRVGGGTMRGVPGGALKGALRRQLADDSAGLMARLGALAALKGEDLADARRPGGLAGALAFAAGGFVKAYVGAGAWREGRLGVLAALAQALYPVLAHLRACEVLDARERALAVAGDGRGPEVVGFGTR